MERITISDVTSQAVRTQRIFSTHGYRSGDNVYIIKKPLSVHSFILSTKNTKSTKKFYFKYLLIVFFVDKIVGNLFHSAFFRGRVRISSTTRANG